MAREDDMVEEWTLQVFVHKVTISLRANVGLG